MKLPPDVANFNFKKTSSTRGSNLLPDFSDSIAWPIYTRRSRGMEPGRIRYLIPHSVHELVYIPGVHYFQNHIIYLRYAKSGIGS